MRHPVAPLALPLVLLTAGCRPSAPPVIPTKAPARVEHAAAETTSSTGGPVFTDVTSRLGVRFVHDAGVDGSYFMPEIMGSGVALFDHDGDGDLDIYVVDSGPHANPWKPGAGRNRMFSQRGDGTFEDVTERSGLGDPGYGQGVAVGDVDDDGDLDVFVTNYGPDALYLNDGHGRFENATAASPDLALARWDTSATFVDYDGDGWLDLYVATYLAYDPAIAWEGPSGEVYCAPDSFSGDPDRLFHNDGDGTFTDVSEPAGVAGRRGKGLGVVAADFTGDGLPDVFVANDGEANVLWVNRGDGTFADEGVKRGVAFDAEGKPLANMGIAMGDADGDGALDLFVTHLVSQTNTLWSRRGAGFEDTTRAAALGDPSVPFTGFGTAFLDFDDDGDLDLVAVNGKVIEAGLDPRAVGGGKPQREPGSLVVSPPARPAPSREAFRAEFGERAQLFENMGAGRFADATERAGGLSAGAEVGRGLAMGDIDDDGDVDLVVSNGFGPVRVLRNDAEKHGAWLTVSARNPALHRDAVGALVTVTAGGRRVVRPIDGAGSYLSSSDARAHFGLGEVAAVDGIEVRWPDGLVESFDGGPVDRRVQLLEGTGRAAPGSVARRPFAVRPPVPVSASAAREAKDALQGALSRGDFLGARELLDRALCANPRDASALADRALVRLALEDHVGESADLDAALLADPAHANARLSRAEARAAAGDTAGALRDLDEAVRLAPRIPRAWHQRGTLRAQSGRLREALEDFDRVVELDPRDPQGHVARAVVQRALGDVTSALANLDAALALSPDPQLYSLRADLRAERGDVAGAAADRDAAHGTPHR